MNYNDLTEKKKSLDAYGPLPVALRDNLHDWFRVELTYTSNALEGNTLTRLETAMVLNKGLAVGGKSLIEHWEATNHAQAMNYIHRLAEQQPTALSCQDILFIHGMVLKTIDDEHAGHYRNVAVRIAGSRVVMPNPVKVPDLMQDFEYWLNNTFDLHPVALAAEAHYRLVSIHPFIDGNGRTARLLMNLLLLLRGYPPAIIRTEDRLAYINAIEHAQLGGSKESYQNIIIEAVDRSLDIYLQAIRDSI